MRTIIALPQLSTHTTESNIKNIGLTISASHPILIITLLLKSDHVKPEENPIQNLLHHSRNFR